VRLRAGGKGGTFLVPHVNPFDGFLTSESVGKTIQGISDDPINAFDARLREGF
jgi:hypothetical protein